MSFPDESTPSPAATASSSSINTTIVASSTPQLVASTLASTAPALSQHLAASSVLSSPIFPPRVAAPSLVPAAAFPMVLPTVPSPGSTGFINPQRFPPQQAFGPSVAPNDSPTSTVPRVPQLLPFAQTQLPQLATVPAGQGNPTFPATPSLFFNQYPVSGPGVSIPGGSFPRSLFRCFWFALVSPCSLSFVCCGAWYPTRSSEISGCDCFGGLYRFRFAVRGPR